MVQDTFCGCFLGSVQEPAAEFRDNGTAVFLFYSQFYWRSAFSLSPALNTDQLLSYLIMMRVLECTKTL